MPEHLRGALERALSHKIHRPEVALPLMVAAIEDAILILNQGTRETYSDAMRVRQYGAYVSVLDPRVGISEPSVHRVTISDV